MSVIHRCAGWLGLALSALVVLASPDSSAQSQPVNASFEVPAVASGSRSATPAGASWTFTGTAGIERLVSSPSTFSINYGGLVGQQAAYLSNTGTNASLGAMTQTITAPVTGSYQLRFLARAAGTSLALRVSVDGTPVDANLTPTPYLTTFEMWWTAAFSLTAGNHIVKVEAVAPSGTPTSGDTIHVDQVVVVTNAIALTNSSFENGGTGWTLSNGANVSSGYYGAAGSQVLVIPSATTWDTMAETTAQVALPAGTYSVSARLGMAGYGEPCAINVQFWGPTITTVGLKVSRQPNYLAPVTSGAVTLPAGNYTIKLNRACNAGNNANALIDAININSAGAALANASFASPDLGPLPDQYSILRQANPAGASWTFGGADAGIQSNAGTYAGTEVRTDDGYQFGDIDTAPGSFTQSQTVAAGTYVMVAKAARGTFQFTLNGQVVGGSLHGSYVSGPVGDGAGSSIYAYPLREVMSEPFTVASTGVVSFGFNALTGFSLQNPRLIRIADNPPPTVNITAPTALAGKTYAVVHGPGPASVTVNATAADSDGLAANSLLVRANGTQIGGTSSVSPFSATGSGLAAGMYTLQAFATDAGGRLGASAPLQLKVNNPPQGGFTVQNAGPHHVEPGAVVSLTFSALPTDSDGVITQVEFLLDGVVVSSCTRTAAPWGSCTVNATPRTANYSLSVRATDDDGGVTTYPATSVIVNALPVINAITVSFGSSTLAPQPAGTNNYSRPGPASLLNVSVSASDVADGGSVTNYTYRIDGAPITSCTAATNTPCNLDTLAAKGTPYVVTVVVSDNRGGTRTSAPINIAVTSGATAQQVVAPRITAVSTVGSTPAATRQLQVTVDRAGACGGGDSLQIFLNGVKVSDAVWSSINNVETRTLTVTAAGTYLVDAYVLCSSLSQLARATNAPLNSNPITLADADFVLASPPDIEDPNAVNAVGIADATLPGSATVGPSGAVTYSIPVPVSPGTNGMQPSLALNYSSQAGRGLLGVGWSLTGFSTIHRCPATVAIDGFKGSVSFSTDDRFCIDGMRLIPVSGGSLQDGGIDVEYRTERDSYARIYSRAGGVSGLYWTMETKSGQTLIFNEPLYKSSSNGTSWDTSKVKAWGVSRVQDSVGNYMLVSYLTDHGKGWMLPRYVDYTGLLSVATVGTQPTVSSSTSSPYAQLEITYDSSTRADTAVVYDGTGSYGVTPPVITSITSRHGASIAHQVNLGYESSATTGRTRLISVQACGGGATPATGLCTRATTFAYNNAAVDTGAPWTVSGNIGFSINLAAGRGVLPLDVNGDGKTDLLPSSYFDAQLTPYAQYLTFSSVPPGVGSSRCPLGPCSSDINSPLVLGDFNGDGYTDFMGTVEIIYNSTLQSRFFVCLTQPATPTTPSCSIKDWGSHNNYADLAYTGGVNQTTSPLVPYYVVGDFDGDGKTDVLVSASSLYVRVDSAGERLPSTFAIGDPEKIVLGDFDGDGRLDVAEQLDSPSSGFSNWRVTLSRTKPRCPDGTPQPNNSCSSVAEFAQIAAGPGPRKRNYQPHIADLNGDSLADLLGFDGNPEQWTSNGIAPDYGITPYLGQFRWHGCLSRGDGTFDCTVWRGPPSGELEFAGKKYPLEILGDFNGDGRTDLAVYDADGSARVPNAAGIWWICVSKPVYGGSSDRGAFDCGPSIAGSTLQGGGVWSVGLRRVGCTSGCVPDQPQKQYGYDVVVAGDFDGNGRTGLAGGTLPPGQSGPSPITRLNVPDPVAKIPDMLSQVTNGLGFVSSFSYKPITDNTIYTKENIGAYPVLDIQTAMYVATEVKHDDGLNTGGKARYTYKYKGLRGHTTGGGTLGFSTVRVTDEQNGVTTETTYDNSYPARGLPLRTRKLVQTVAGEKAINESTTEYYAPIRAYGSANSVQQKIHAILPKRTTERSWEAKRVPTDTAYVVYDTDPDYAMPVTVTETVYGNADPSLAAATAEGQYGCATSVDAKTYKVVIAPNTEDFSKSVVNEYDNSTAPGKWWLCQLKTATTTSKQKPYVGPDIPDTEVRQAGFDYYPATGLLWHEFIQPSLGVSGDTDHVKLTTEYAYDTFGNRKSAKATGWINYDVTQQVTDDGRTTSAKYATTDGRFLTEATNAAGHVSKFEFETLRGQQTKLTDPNALDTFTKYDKLGRKVTEKYPDGTKTVWSYAASSAGGIAVTTRTTAGAEAVVETDRLGREVLKRVKVSDNGTLRWSCVNTVYDARGRVDKVSRPYWCGGTAIYPTVRTYDFLDRVISETTTGDESAAATTSTTVTTSYRGLRTVVSSSGNLANNDVQGVLSNRTVETLRDARGAVQQIIRTGAATISHAYDAAGNLRQTTRTVGAEKMVTSMGYDLRGRKKSLSDPDTGSYSYVYNAFGELVSQTDGRGNVTRSDYDLIGRLIRRRDLSGSDHDASYIYDGLADLSCTKAIGKLCRATASGARSPSGLLNTDGYQRDIRYDSVGRPNQETTLIATSSAGVVAGSGARQYQVATTYDNFGRVATIRYPNGQVAMRGYDSVGAWNKLSTGSGKVLWQGGAVDPEARWLGWTLGNTVATTTSFGINSGRLLTLNSTTPAPVGGGSAQIVQALNLTYDGYGNIKTRLDQPNGYQRAGGGAETYGYDHFDRLATATYLPNGQQTDFTQAVQYDDFGRISSKTGIGAYQYRTSSVNGSTTSSRVQLANGRSYDYDGSGNVTSITNTVSTSAGQVTGTITLSWASFNQPFSLPVAAGDNASALATNSKDAAINMAYGPDYARVREDLPSDNTANRLGTNLSAQRYLLHSGASLFYEEDLRGDNTSREQRVYFAGPLGIVAVHTTNTDASGSPQLPIGAQSNTANANGTPYTLTYWHRDHLGSLTVTTDETGTPRESMRYDPWGKPLSTLVSRARGADRGFTGHEHLAGGLIHMNGRIYDPVLGIFLSPDIVVQFPGAATSYNRYAYVMNNPLLYTDPSGYFIAELAAILVEIGMAKAAATIAAYAITASLSGGAIALATGHNTAARRFFAAAIVFATAGTAYAGWGAFAAGGLQSGTIEGAIMAVAGSGFGQFLGPIVADAFLASASALSSALGSDALSYLAGNVAGCLACGVSTVEPVLVTANRKVIDGITYATSVAISGTAVVFANGDERLHHYTLSAKRIPSIQEQVVDILAPDPRNALMDAAYQAQASGDHWEAIRLATAAIGVNMVTGVRAPSSKQAANLAKHLGYAEKYGVSGVKQLENGRFRYYGAVQPANKAGEMAGRRYVHEFDPGSGRSRGWHETVDQNGTVRQVRPELNNGTKTHYRFDSNGRYMGSW